MHFPEFVDAHPDDEHDEVAVDLRADALGNDTGHQISPRQPYREAMMLATSCRRPAIVDHGHWYVKMSIYFLRGPVYWSIGGVPWV